MTAQLDAVLSIQTHVKDDHILVDLPFEDDLLGTLIGEVAFTRASIGTFLDKDDGLVKTTAANVARFEAKGYKTEGPSENVIIQSEDYTKATWSNVGVTVTANAGTAPDGSNNGTRISDDGAGFDTLSQVPAGMTANVHHTVSIFAKAETGSTLDLFIGNAGFTNLATVDFNVSAGTVGTVVEVGSASSSSASIENFGNGWFRCSLTTIVDAVATTLRHDISSTDGTNAVLIWGSQFEELNFASSYIPTTTVAVPREADFIVIDGTNHPELKTGIPYSITCDVDTRLKTGEGADPFWAAEGAGTSLLRIEAGNDFKFFRDVASPTTGGSYTEGTTVSLAVTVGATDLVTIYSQGVAVASATESPDNPGNLDSVQIGGFADGTVHMFGHIKNLKILDIELDAAEVVDTDLAIENTTVDFDISIDADGDILTDDFFDTAILYSLFGERRASSSEVSEARLRRGWIGSEGAPFENGSKLWLLTQARITRTILSRLEDEAVKALEWMVTDNIAVAITDVTATVSNGKVALNLTIERSTDNVERRFFELWNNTGIR